MKKLLVPLAAMIMVLPLIGCNKADEDTDPIKIQGKTPDAAADPTNKGAGGADFAVPQ